MRRVTSIFLVGLVSLACAGSLHAGAGPTDEDDTTFEVDFFNGSSSAGTVYVNGNSVCTLAVKQSCDQDLAKSGGSYATVFRSADGSEVSRSIDASTCGDEGAVNFDISDNGVDITCNGWAF